MPGSGRDAVASCEFLRITPFQLHPRKRNCRRHGADASQPRKGARQRNGTRRGSFPRRLYGLLNCEMAISDSGPPMLVGVSAPIRPIRCCGYWPHGTLLPPSLLRTCGCRLPCSAAATSRGGEGRFRHRQPFWGGAYGLDRCWCSDGFRRRVISPDLLSSPSTCVPDRGTPG